MRAVRALPVLCLLGLAACAGHPAHPVTGARGATPRAATTDDDWTPVLRHVRENAVWRCDHPGLVLLPHVELDVLRRSRGRTALGPLRNVAAFGVHGPSPLPPHAMADLVLDAEAERQALAATTFLAVPDPQAPSGPGGAAYRVEFLDRGVAPFTFDFRFTIRVDRRALPGGAVLLRYGAIPTGDQEGVSLYRGACLIEPEGEGSRVTEVLVVGTMFRVPFFLARTARAASLRLFQDRANALWTRARWRAEGTDPLLVSSAAATPGPR